MSPVIYRLMMAVLAGLLPEAKRVVFPEVSHVAPLLAMDAFNAEAIAFIEHHLA